MLVQQRYSECEQMLGLLEAAVQQVDVRFRCRATPSSPPTQPQQPIVFCVVGSRCLG